MIDNININENQSKMSWIIMSFSILRYEYKQFLSYYQDIVVDEYLTLCGKKKVKFNEYSPGRRTCLLLQG